ncbi:GNAT family N-acetyltransferase, partial [Paraburkholderia sp. Se-20369]|nr:GNAT family N-acetyltransferase [Paraburkholderia sp. Se-20369]
DAQRLYLEELDVAPSHAGQRIGVRLIEQVAARAAEDGCAQIVLSTFRAPPWNAPYYRRLGFDDIDDATLDDTLRAIRAYHVSLGLDETRRVFMRRDLRA